MALYRVLLLAAIRSAVAAAQNAFLAARRSSPHVKVVAYGSSPDQYGELWLPDGGKEPPTAVVTLVHGGAWLDAYGEEHMDKLAWNLTARGIAAWKLEYRRVGSAGWTNYTSTLGDISKGMDMLNSGCLDLPTGLPRAVLGHSAGGHLAFQWHLQGLLDGSSTRAAQDECLAVSVAGVLDLRLASAQNLTRGAAADFLGGRTDDQTYFLTSPAEMLPSTASGDDDGGALELQRRPAVLIHGDLDNVVPADQALSFQASANRVGLPCELRRVPSEGHFEILEPSSASWRQSLEAMEAYFEEKRREKSEF